MSNGVIIDLIRTGFDLSRLSMIAGGSPVCTNPDYQLYVVEWDGDYIGRTTIGQCFYICHVPFDEY